VVNQDSKKRGGEEAIIPSLSKLVRGTVAYQYFFLRKESIGNRDIIISRKIILIYN
jgi:hypothetical protein